MTTDSPYDLQEDLQVAVLLHKYFPHGGGQRDAANLVSSLAARSIRASILTPRVEGQPPAEVSVQRIPVSGFPNFVRYQQFEQVMEQLRTARPNLYVVSYVRVAACDHYVVADPCFRESLPGKRPLWAAELNPRDRYFLDAERRMFEGQCSLSFLNEAQKSAYHKHYEIDDASTQILPCEVREDCKWHAASEGLRQATRRELNLSDDELVCIAAGSGFHTKGLDRSIEALRALQQSGTAAHLLVVGDDDDRRYQKLVRQHRLGNSVTFLGGRDDLPRLYFCADLLLHPARFEAAGKVLIEAMAAGLGVLTTNACGYAEHIEAANAGVVLAAPFQQAALNRALSYAAKLSRREKFRQNGISYTKDMAANASTEALADWVQEAMAARTPAITSS